MKKPRVTDADRDYFRRLGEFERQNHEEHQRYLDSLGLDERLRRSIRRTLAGKPYPRKEPEDPGAFYERAKSLGLYRG